MSVGEIKSYLDVLVGVLNHDDAVVVNVCALPFALEEDCTTVSRHRQTRMMALSVFIFC